MRLILHSTMLVFLITFCRNSDVSAQQQSLQERIYEKCLPAARKTMSEGASRYYCNCYADSVNRFYAAEKYIPQKDTLKSVADSCLGKTQSVYQEKTFEMRWNEESKNKFLVSCENELEGSTVNALIYCNCVLDKIMAVYSDPQQFYHLSAEEKNTISSECIDQK